MKVYLSADMEGIAGASSWDDIDPSKPEYGPHRERMIRHVEAACEGAVAAGADDILVKDAHFYGRNLDPARLPRCARLARGWTGGPLMMVEHVDETFDAAAFVGYHAGAGSGGNPDAHTLSSSKIAGMTLNGEPLAEYHLYALGCALHGVPVVFVSGDRALCEEVGRFSPKTVTVPVLEGVGGSSVSLHPEEAAERIRAGMEEALRGDPADCALEVPGRCEFAVRFKEAPRAYRGSFYPGAELLDAHTVRIATDDFLDILRALVFLL